VKYSEFKEGDRVVVIMPKGSGQRELITTVIEKGDGGIVLLQREDGRRFFINAHRIKRRVEL